MTQRPTHPTFTGDGPSLYERIGGHTGVGSLVEAFYDGVMRDPELAPFFKHVRSDRLHDMQTAFFAAALGGPVDYSGPSIGRAHHGRGIKLHHVQRFAQHLFDTLSAFNLSDADRVAAVARINGYLADLTHNQAAE
jgi:hemoglobin